jgi:hypothetical protein
MCLCKGNTFKGLLKNHWTIKGKIYMKAFWHSTKASLLKSCLPQGSGGATIGSKAQIYIEVFILSTSNVPGGRKGGGHNKGTFFISWKPLNSLPLSCIYSCFLCQVASDGMYM